MDALAEAHSAVAETESRVEGGEGKWRGEINGRGRRRRDEAEQSNVPRVYSRAEIPGLGGEPSPPPPPPQQLRGQAWPEEFEERESDEGWPEPKAPVAVVVGARAAEKRRSDSQPRRAARLGLGDADGPVNVGSTAVVVGAEVSLLLKELREEQSALREHVEKHTEVMTALQIQARAERERAHAELAAVRSRMQPPSEVWDDDGDSLDQFVVETHILPKHVNSIPDDLEMLPAMDERQRHGGRRAPTPELPSTSTRQRVPPGRGLSSPAIIRGDLGDIRKVRAAQQRLFLYACALLIACRSPPAIRL